MSLSLSPLWLKLSLMPLLLLLVAWTSRRYGPHVAGLVTGLPVISGPVSVFCAMSSGASFASHAAPGALAGLAGVGAFCGAYGWASHHVSWPRALACGLGGFLAVSVIVQHLSQTLGVLSLAAWGALVAVRLVLGRAAPGDRCASAEVVDHDVVRASENWELPARIVLATGLVVGLTAVSERLGARWSGICSTVPVLSAIVAVFTHARDDARAVRVFLTGVAGASLGTVGFFVVVGGHLAAGALVSTYALALGATLVIHALSAKLVVPRGSRRASG
ncbi:hypothetical protein [Pendulispora albinea]|uniref:Uncharacterized protein n=1 Tax=Pendulispora albinea TaxID=2741071 RepID=A0ABZ2LWH1_9BACT